MYHGPGGNFHQAFRFLLLPASIQPHQLPACIPCMPGTTSKFSATSCAMAHLVQHIHVQLV